MLSSMGYSLCTGRLSLVVFPLGVVEIHPCSTNDSIFACNTFSTQPSFHRPLRRRSSYTMTTFPTLTAGPSVDFVSCLWEFRNSRRYPVLHRLQKLYLSFMLAYSPSNIFSVNLMDFFFFMIWDRQQSSSAQQIRRSQWLFNVSTGNKCQWPAV